MSVRLELDLSRLGNANECSTVMASGEPEGFSPNRRHRIVDMVNLHGGEFRATMS